MSDHVFPDHRHDGHARLRIARTDTWTCTECGGVTHTETTEHWEGCPALDESGPCTCMPELELLNRRQRRAERRRSR
jgi:hypothetical protein